MKNRRRPIVLWSCLLLAVSIAAAQPFDPALYAGMRWRLVGPFRGGWSTCVAGVPDKPDTFYFGAAVGGVWRTDDAGHTWSPLFQHETAASVGALAIAPSNPNVIYVGTGQVEARYDLASGDGVYRSDDAGRSWRHLGLQATRAIGAILVDPQNADVILVSALGHLYGSNHERGVFRSQDGGRTWDQTLFINDETGVVDLASDPQHPQVVYAAAWQARNFPWLSYFEPVVGPGSAVYNSTDGGRTWKKNSGKGWPAGELGRIALAVGSGGRVYALVDATPSRADREPRGGLYRSDDGGASWIGVNHEAELASSYFGRITVDPRSPDVLYVMGRSIRRSEDGGKSFRIVKGAPGGDDYHFFWINPGHPDHMATASDQGTTVTVNAGLTWSDWHNQPTGQFYHVATDDRFPYWIYSGQQDSGTVGIASRGDYGAVTYREWHPVGGEERGWDIPDPADPDIIYGTGLGGDVSRFDTRTGQIANVSPSVQSTYARRPTEVKYRYTWISPLAVSPHPPHALYFGSQVLFRSTDRGQSWRAVSPDLTGAVPGTKGCEGKITTANAGPCGFGVIFTIALARQDEREIWIGTDNGRIFLTRDGGATWQDVTPRDLSPWSKVASLEISPLDSGTIYAAIDQHRLDDFSPHAYRTRNFGRTWEPIVAGLASTDFVSVVRADPTRKGLLYAGTSTGVFVSFDDGDHWQSLQQNLPTAWVGDLTIHGEDLVAATQGRAIWILDDLSPLRQMADAAADPIHLFRPAVAIRARANENNDTPLPPETPQGENPPAGAVIDYFLKTAASGVVKVEILDSRDRLVRAFSSEDTPEKITADRYFAEDWIRPAAPPSAAPGHHRLVWDLRYPRPMAANYEYSIAAVWGHDTPFDPQGVLALPGMYRVRLTVGGQSLVQPLTLRMDPRVKVSENDLARQFELAMRTADDLNRDLGTLERARALRKKLGERGKSAAGGRLAKSLADLDGKLRALTEDSAPGPSREDSLVGLSSRFTSVLSAVESADATPTASAITASEELEKVLDRQLLLWKEIEEKDVPAANQRLRAAKLPLLLVE